MIPEYIDEENVQTEAEIIQEEEEDILIAADPAEPEEKKAKKAACKKKKLKKRIAKMNLIFESNSGMQITLKEIAEKIPKKCDAAYVKTEENKIYWVKGEETGSEDIW